MVKYKHVNNELIEITGSELTELETREKAWDDNALNRALLSLRFKRNNLLTESDWTVLPDSPIPDKTAWQNYRTELRDLTNGLTTVEEVDAVIWPTEPGA